MEQEKCNIDPISNSNSNLDQNDNDLRIGSSGLDNVNGANYFKGRIDEVQLYNRALSTSEIQMLILKRRKKNDTSTTSVVAPPPPPSSALGVTMYKSSSDEED